MEKENFVALRSENWGRLAALENWKFCVITCTYLARDWTETLIGIKNDIWEVGNNNCIDYLSFLFGNSEFVYLYWDLCLVALILGYLSLYSVLVGFSCCIFIEFGLFEI